MAQPLVSDELWAIVEPLIPVARGRRLLAFAGCFGGAKTGPNPVNRRTKQLEMIEAR